MGVDVVATAKTFEQHAEKGHIPELLARELNSLSDADRLAVAKQIEWDMKHQSNPDLPKVEFYDTGNLKSIERVEKFSSGTGTETEVTVLDKTTGKTKAEYITTVVNDPKLNEFSTRLEILERDTKGHLTLMYNTAIRLNGTKITAHYDENRYAYDPTTGKQITHDERTSWGRKVHEEYDPKTGHEKFAVIEDPKGNINRTYDQTTGELRQEDIVRPKSQQTIKYNSNGDKIYSETRFGKNGDKGMEIFNYSPRTGKPIYTELRDENGKVLRRDNIDDNGVKTRIKD